MSEDTVQLQRRIDRLQAQLQRVESQARQAWAYPTITPAASKPMSILRVIGGNDTAIGVPGIRYAPNPTISAWDPNTDTTYPDGVGRGQLFIDGILQAGYVLIRHDFTGYTGPVLKGEELPVRGTMTLTSGATTMTAYTFQGYP